MPVEPLKETPSQTAGPYVHIGAYPSAAGLPVRTQTKPNVAFGPGAKGPRIRIEGLVRDGAGSPVTDAMVELWQADADGKFAAKDAAGFGRSITDFSTGEYWFETVKPGATKPAEAPFVTLLIFARGINIHLRTRMYFEDETSANAADPALKAVGDPRLQATLMGRKSTRDGQTIYRFDIVLQGENETVFFD
jgi:protocatechuate 3,4-dioxygenase, alpha subunit